MTNALSINADGTARGWLTRAYVLRLRHRRQPRLGRATAPLVGAEPPEVGIQPPAVDVDIAVPVDAALDAIFSIMRHGVGDTRPSDFAVVVRLV